MRTALPGFETGDGPVAESWHDGKHGVEVLGLFTLAGDFDVLLDDAHPFGHIGLGDNLGDRPHHLPVDQLTKKTQTRGAISGKKGRSQNYHEWNQH